MKKKKVKEKRFKNYKKTILAIIYKALPNCKVYLFGSRARSEHDEGADIDIALDAGAPIANKIISLIREKIKETTIPLTVDVVDLYSASDVLKKEVKNEGILWEN